MTNPTIALIIEGRGEVDAAATLVRRVALEKCNTYADTPQPFRLDSAKMRKPDELSKAIRTVAARVTDRGGVLIIRDGDDNDIDCPLELARQMQPSAELVPVSVQIVIARHEYEAWFLAGIESLRSHRSIRDDAVPPADPEAKRGAKEQLRQPTTESYRPTLHQAKFSALLDLQLAHDRSRSFRRLVSVVSTLVTAVDP